MAEPRTVPPAPQADLSQRAASSSAWGGPGSPSMMVTVFPPRPFRSIRRRAVIEPGGGGTDFPALDLREQRHRSGGSPQSGQGGTGSGSLDHTSLPPILRSMVDAPVDQFRL